MRCTVVRCGVVKLSEGEQVGNCVGGYYNQTLPWFRIFFFYYYYYYN